MIALLLNATQILWPGAAVLKANPRGSNAFDERGSAFHHPYDLSECLVETEGSPSRVPGNCRTEPLAVREHRRCWAHHGAVRDGKWNSPRTNPMVLYWQHTLCTKQGQDTSKSSFWIGCLQFTCYPVPGYYSWTVRKELHEKHTDLCSKRVSTKFWVVLF